MIDLILAGIIVALLGFIAWERYETRKEYSKLINAIVSKNATELRDLDFVDKVQPPKIERTQPDFLPEEQISDEKWQEMITKEANG